jgi:hypothetical protein
MGKWKDVFVTGVDEGSSQTSNARYIARSYALEQAQALGLDRLANGQIDDSTGVMRFYSQRAQRIFDLFYGYVLQELNRRPWSYLVPNELDCPQHLLLTGQANQKGRG